MFFKRIKEKKMARKVRALALLNGNRYGYITPGVHFHWGSDNRKLFITVFGIIVMELVGEECLRFKPAAWCRWVRQECRAQRIA